MKRLIFVFFIAFLITGCSDDPTTAIVGEWAGVDVPQDMKFNSDGTVEMNDRKHGTYHGEYTITGKGELKCNFERLSRPVEMTVSISGSKMVMESKSKRKEKYKRK